MHFSSLLLLPLALHLPALPVLTAPPLDTGAGDVCPDCAPGSGKLKGHSGAHRASAEGCSGDLKPIPAVFGASSSAEAQAADKKAASAAEKPAKKSAPKKAATTTQRGVEVAPAAEGEYIVAAVLKQRDTHREPSTRQYLVHWKGYPSSEDSWEPESSLRGNVELARFLEKNPEKKRKR